MYIVIKCRSKFLSSLVKASLLLCETLCESLNNCSENSLNVIAEAILTLLCTLDLLTINSDLCDREKDETLKSLSNILYKWIVKSGVIGGSVFGNSIPSYHQPISRWKGEKEVKVSYT